MLSKFHASKFEFHYVLDSINWFIHEGLCQCIEAKTYDLLDGRVARLRFVRVTKPQFELQGQMFPLFPAQAELEGKNYFMSVWVKVEVYGRDDVVEVESPEFILLEIPAVVYSDACHHSDVPKRDFHPLDPGCNLIINGHPYVMLMVERARLNILVLRIDQDFSMLPYIYQLTQTALQTSYTSIFMADLHKPESGSAILGVKVVRYVSGKYKDAVADIEGQTEQPPAEEEKKKKSDVHKEQLLNVLSTCYILLTSSAERALMTGPDLAAAMYNYYQQIASHVLLPESAALAKDFFVGTEEEFVANMAGNPNLAQDAQWLRDQMTAKETIFGYFHRLLRDIIPRHQLHNCLLRFADTEQTFASATTGTIYTQFYAKLKVGASENASAVAEKYFRESMFPLLPSTLDKINMLITMSCRLLQCKAGYTAVTDMSNWQTRGLYLIGDLYYETLCRKLLKAHAMITSQNEFKSITSVASSTRAAKKNPAVALADMIKATNIEGKFMSEIRALKAQQFAKAKIKASSAHEEKTSLMLLEHVTTAEKRAALTKHRNNTSTNSPSTRQSSVEANSFPAMDTTKATEGKTAGVNKFISQHTSITKKTDPDVLVDVLRTFVIPISIGLPIYILSGFKSDLYTIPVFINSVLRGYTHRAGYVNIVKLKRYGKIDRECCVVYIDSLNLIEIFCDAHRLIYPASVCDRNAAGQTYPAIFGRDWKWDTPNGKQVWSGKMAQDTRWKQMSFHELLIKGFVQYLDVRESENRVVRLAQTFASFVNHAIDIQFVEAAVETAKASGNAVYIANAEHQLRLVRKYWPTYALLHPMAAYSITCATVQFFDKLQACRISYTEKMENHKMGEFLDNRDAHTSRVQPMFHTAARVNSRMNELIGIRDRPSGKSIMFALYPDVSNEEDAFVLSKTLAENGKFHYMKTVAITEKLEGSEQFGRVILGTDHSHHSRFINENGLPTVGVYIEHEDKVIGKYEVFKDVTERGEEDRWVDKSRVLERTERGYVREVCTFRTTTATGQLTGQKAVSVRLDKINQPKVGGKFATLDVQKHILADTRAKVDMLTILETGEPIDGAFSPMGVLTRMSIGVLLRPLLGTLAAQTGALPDTQGHKYLDVSAVMDTLESHGFSRKGVYTVLDGITGKKRKAQILVGPARLAALVRTGEEQLQVRGWEKNNPVTGQADTSKAATKGQKYTHYEGTACTAYGASGVVYDRMNECCDGSTIVVCRYCSFYASFDPNEKTFVCRNCDTVSRDNGDQFGLFDMSRTLMYLSVSLMTIGRHLKPKYITESEYLLGKIPQKEVPWITEETLAEAETAQERADTLLATHGQSINDLLKGVN